MDITESSLDRKSVVEKLNQVPDELVQTISDFIDGLVKQHEEVSSITAQDPVAAQDSSVRKDLSSITTWDEWFDAVQQLPEVPGLSNLSKQERQEIMTEAIVEKYERKGLEHLVEGL